MKKFLVKWKSGNQEFLWGRDITAAIRSKYHDIAALGIESWEQVMIMFVVTWKKNRGKGKERRELVEGFTFEEALENAGYCPAAISPYIKSKMMVEEVKEKGRD